MLKSVALAFLLLATGATAQVAPSPAEIAEYRGLHAAAAAGDLSAARAELDRGADIAARDGHGRTALHVAGHRGDREMALLLLQRGADANALDARAYDLVTVAAVRDDAAMVRLALANGGKAGNVTSPWRGTALIAAAHLGHVEPIRALIEAGAPLDHVNTLGWTALIEAIVLGDGGERHAESLRLLVAAGANPNLPDRDGVTPLGLARARGYTAMMRILERAGAR